MEKDIRWFSNMFSCQNIVLNSILYGALLSIGHNTKEVTSSWLQEEVQGPTFWVFFSSSQAAIKASYPTPETPQNSSEH